MIDLKSFSEEELQEILDSHEKVKKELEVRKTIREHISKKIQIGQCFLKLGKDSIFVYKVKSFSLLYSDVVLTDAIRVYPNYSEKFEATCHFGEFMVFKEIPLEYFDQISNLYEKTHEEISSLHSNLWKNSESLINNELTETHEKIK